MAIRREVFDRLGIRSLWSRALTDDLSLSYVVRRAGLKIAYVPSCLVASHLTTTWTSLFEFARRQFLITRVYAFRTWLFGLVSVILSIAGPWGSLGLTMGTAWLDTQWSGWGKTWTVWPVWAGLSFCFFSLQCLQAWVRQDMIVRLLPDKAHQLKTAKWADILGFWLWSFLLLITIIASGIGRNLRWRGIHYRLLGPTDVIILDR